MVIRFRNSTGIATELFAQRVSWDTTNVIEFTASSVQALAGANSIEIVRNGPTASGISFWIQYDFLRLESLGGTGVLFAGRTSTPSGLIPPPKNDSPAAPAILGNGVVSVSGQDYLRLTFLRPEPVPPGFSVAIEATSDLLHWSEVKAVVMSVETHGNTQVVTVRDPLPLGSAATRFLRLRVLPTSEGADVQGRVIVPR